MARPVNNEPETVLVVDDDAAVRTLEVRILHQLGHKVLEAQNPAEAMRLAAVTPTIDLLLTDFSMPDSNGLELARRFRAVHPKTPVLMVSGSLEAIHSHGEPLDRFAVLAKPFTPEELADQVCEMLGDSTAHPAAAAR